VISTKSILISLAAIITAASVPIHLNAKNKNRGRQEKNNDVFIGFQTGKNYKSIISPEQPYHSKLPQQINSYGGYIRKTISRHFKIETGLDYIQPYNLPVIHPAITGTRNYTGQSTLSVPLLVDYFLLPEKHRVNPFCGFGLEFNHTLGTYIPFTPTEENTLIPNTQLRQYLSVVFTQGVNIEINTKIEFSQSFHFLPESNNKSLGFNIGFGYKIK
jgi:hypothetical protein